MNDSMKLFLEILVKGSKGTSDEALVKLIKNNNTRAFRMIYERYKNPIYSYVKTMVYTQSVAEELTQEVFLKVFNRIELFSFEYKFKTWLWTIARNTCFDYLKRKDAMLFTNDVSGDKADIIENMVVDFNHAELQLVEKSEREEITKCIDKLSVEKKNVLMMRLFSELSYEEIAKGTDCSVGAIKSMIHRTKQFLKECLQAKERQHG